MKESTFAPWIDNSALQTCSDRELVQELTRRAACERHATADSIRTLIEFDRRQLYLAQGYPSLFAYCTGALHYSEYAAFNRIEVARAAARWPQLLASLEDGSLHLAGARLLAPHLTADNIEMALASARHKSKRDIEEIAAGLAQRSVLVAVAAEQYRLHLTISRAARDTLRQIQALISHQVEDGNAAVIVEQALTLLLEKLQRQRFAATDRPRPSVGEPGDGASAVEPAVPPEAGTASRARSRHIPNAVKRAVWTRDDGRCAFVGAEGRCAERHRLEFHHLIPFAAGGRSSKSNLELRCQAHNAFEAELYFGAERMAAVRQVRASRATAPPVNPSASPAHASESDDSDSAPRDRDSESDGSDSAPPARDSESDDSDPALLTSDSESGSDSAAAASDSDSDGSVSAAAASDTTPPSRPGTSSRGAGVESA